MGRYATTTSISLLVPNLLKGNTTTSDSEGTAIFSKHIDRAEDAINALLGARFQTPFTTTAVPPLVKTCAEDAAVYYTMRAEYAQDGQIEQKFIDDFKDSWSKLQAVASGDMMLLLSDGSLAPSRKTTRYLSTSKNWTPIFGRDDQSKWGRDDDEIDDLEADRG